MNILYANSGSEGVGTYFRGFFWAKYLVKRGHKVTVIYAHNKPSYKIMTVKYVDGVKVINLIKTNFKWDYPGYLIRTLLVFWLCLTERYDVLHSFVVCQPPSALALVAGLMKRLLNRKKISVIADWDDWWGKGGISEEHNLLVRKGVTFMEKHMPRLADQVTVCSNFIKEKAVEIGYNPDTVTLIPNGANIDAIQSLPRDECRERLGLDTRLRYLCYIGQFHTTCVPIMFKAFEHAARRLPNIRLLVIGNVPESYHRMVTGNEQLASRVTLVGKVPYENIGTYLSAADILLLPMDTTILEWARWPIRFGDYMAAGRPILSNAVGEVRLVIERHACGVLTDFEDPDAFAGKVAELLADEKAREAIGTTARRVAEESYSWNAIAQQVEATYEQAQRTRT